MGKPKSKAMLDEGIWHQFEDAEVENRGINIAVVVLTLDRATGRVEVDDTMSTVMETWAMVATIQEKLNDHVNVANGLSLD